MGRRKIWKHFFQNTMQKRFTAVHKHLNCHIYSSHKSCLLLECYLPKYLWIHSETTTQCHVLPFLWEAHDYHSWAYVHQLAGQSKLTTCKLVTRKRQWHPTPVLLPGESHGRRSLVGCSPWGSQRIGYDWGTSLSLFTFMHWRRKWQATPVFLPGESQGQQSLVGCRLWGCRESDITDAT